MRVGYHSTLMILVDWDHFAHSGCFFKENQNKQGMEGQMSSVDKWHNHMATRQIYS